MLLRKSARGSTGPSGQEGITRQFASRAPSRRGRKWGQFWAQVMMFSTSRVCELSTYSFNSRPQSKKNTLQNLIGGTALIWIAGACSWTVVSNINGPAVPTSRSAPAAAVRNANALVAAAHNEFFTARNEFASARAAFTIAAQQKFATALRHEPAAMQGKLASYVALIDDAVLDARGPIATLGGRLTDDIAPRSDWLMVASADPQVKPQAAIGSPAPTVRQTAQSIPLPTPKPSELRVVPEKPTATAMATKPAALAIAAATANDSAKDDAPASIFSGLKHIASLAYAPSDGGLSRDKVTTLAALRGDDRAAAVYDIAAHVVYMPDGSKLEAHSGLGEYLDDPKYVSKRMRGATPPHTYDLSLRESPFHGVQAIRLTPVGGEDEIFGRDGLLAHTYMLGPRGDSNGCVSFRNYEAFLNAYRNNEVKRLVVVARLS